MAWNQTGSGGKDDAPKNNERASNDPTNNDPAHNDPWGQNNRQRGSANQPPDLDEVLRQAKDKIDSLFSGRKGGGKNGDGNDPSGGSDAPVGKRSVLIVLGVLLGFWTFTGFYTVDEGEQAIELRFGKHIQTNDAGLHWHIPAPIETVEIVNTQNVNTVVVGYRENGRSIQAVPREALMLTEDENIIDIHFAVQYDVKNPAHLLFNVSEYNTRDLADPIVRQATESAVREIVGRNSMDFAITEGRAQLATAAKTLIQDILDRYETGVNIRRVEMQNAQPPEQVKDAFDDTVRAREDEERLKNLAEAYANDIIPKARGFSARILQEAEAYKAATIAKAEGETARFDQVLDEYAKAPEITRDRLYLETMEQVFTRTSKMIIDQKDGGNNVMYLPLDQLLKNREQSANPSQFSTGDGVSAELLNTNNSVSSSSTRGVDRTSRQ